MAPASMSLKAARLRKPRVLASRVKRSLDCLLRHREDEAEEEYGCEEAP